MKDKKRIFECMLNTENAKCEHRLEVGAITQSQWGGYLGSLMYMCGMQCYISRYTEEKNGCVYRRSIDTE